jgi:hypothetical protein
LLPGDFNATALQVSFPPSTGFASMQLQINVFADSIHEITEAFLLMASIAADTNGTDERISVPDRDGVALVNIFNNDSKRREEREGESREDREGRREGVGREERGRKGERGGRKGREEVGRIEREGVKEEEGRKRGRSGLPTNCSCSNQPQLQQCC